jgi:DNA-binding HxlR family transcriptional regulator
VFPEVPPRVEYELTAMGRTLIHPAVTLAEWAIDNNPHIEQSQEAYDSRRRPAG